MAKKPLAKELTTKRRRQDLDARRRRLPWISARALGAIYYDIEQHGIPECIGSTSNASRVAVRRARDDALSAETPYGQWPMDVPRQITTTADC